MNWLAHLVGKRKKIATASNHRPRPVLQVELLEDRLVPSADFLPTYVHGSPNHGTSAHPNYGSATPSGLTPATMQQAYGANQVMFGSVAGNGSGQTIAIIDAYDQPNMASDLANFDQQYGLPAPTSFKKINENGGTALPGGDPQHGWGVETSLDVEWAHVIAPAANILLVEANSASTTDLNAAINTARSYAGVSVVSMSFGSNETSSDYSGNSLYTTPTGHNGVTFVASSGDSGAYSDTGSSTKIVEYPASSVNVVGVGGTTLSTGAVGVYASESGWGNGTNSYNYGGSGGGISKYEAQPSYQHGVETQSFRTVPDVSLDADPNSGVPVDDSYDNGTSTPWEQVGGTSLAAPMFSGVIAIANQGRALNGLGTLDGPSQTLPMLYALASSDFHDVTTGNNGYAAGPGYDYVTGRGTPIVNLVASGLAGSSTGGTGTPTIGSFTVSPTSVQVGTAATLTASNVTETGGAISSVTFYRESNGTAGLQIGADTLVGTGTLSGSTWTVSASTTGLVAGTYTFYAVATDSTGHTSIVASTTLTVTAASTLTATTTQLSTGPVTYYSNGMASTVLTVTVTPTAGSTLPTGTVAINYGGSVLGTGTLHIVNGVAQVSFTITFYTYYYYEYYTFSATFEGNSNFTASTSNSVTVAIA